MSKYTLKSGQINFESNENSGAYACVVIRDGQFYNLTESLRTQLIGLLQPPNGPERQNPEKQEIDVEDMF